MSSLKLRLTFLSHYIFPNIFSHYFFALSSYFLQTDQLMSEKLTGADHTKLDDQFTQMEKITDVFLEVEVSHLF